MASFDFDRTSCNYHIRFRCGGKPFKRSLRLEDDREAERVCGVVDETIKDLKRGRLAIPEGVDIGAFLISGGRVTGKPKAQSLGPDHGPRPLSIGEVFATYVRTLTPGCKE